MSAFVNRVQAFEHRLQAHMSEVFCPVHLCLGHEEIADELHKYMEPQDWLFSNHRAHGHYFAKGGSEEALWDEIMGLESGINKGFSGSQEFSDPAINFHCSAIVGGLVGVATGTAWVLRGTGAVVICIMGDAAMEQGVVWESMNFAALHKLPIAYICENNGKSVDSLIEERQATPIPQKVKAFGVEIRSTIKRVFLLARQGIPAFCEMKVTLKCDHINMACMQTW